MTVVFVAERFLHLMPHSEPMETTGAPASTSIASVSGDTPVQAPPLAPDNDPGAPPGGSSKATQHTAS